MERGQEGFPEDFPGGSDSKESVYNTGFLGQEDPLEMEMATHASILAWRIPWTEEHEGLQFMGLQRVRHDRVTNTCTSQARWMS